MKFSFLMGFLWASLSFAAIPKSSMILQRLSENAGGGVYQIEQEVQFPNGLDNMVLRETWLIDNENNMKLQVTGAKDLKDRVSFSIQITNGVHSVTKQRISGDFIERYFHIRGTEGWAQTLQQMGLAPANILARKPIKNLKEMDYTPESFVRLSRSGGVVAYAFGGLSTPEKEVPGVWIEQDQFLLRKVRTTGLAEVTADRYGSYAKGLNFPRTRNVRWGTNQVTIQTLSVTSKGKDAFTSFAPKGPAKMEGIQNQHATALVEEFYRRFR